MKASWMTGKYWDHSQQKYCSKHKGVAFGGKYIAISDTRQEWHCNGCIAQAKRRQEVLAQLEEMK